MTAAYRQSDWLIAGKRCLEAEFVSDGLDFL